MNFRYDNRFSKEYRTFPAAVFLHHMVGKNYFLLDNDGNYQFTNPHNHAEFEILLIQKGSGFVKIGSSETQVPFQEGDLIIFNPFEAHCGSYWKETPEQLHYCVDFAVDLLDHPHIPLTKQLSDDLLSQNICCKTIISPDASHYSELKQDFLTMYQAILQKDQTALKLMSAMFDFFSTLYSENYFLRTPQAPLKNCNTEFVKRVMQYVNDHFMDSISTRNVAESFNYSKEHFCRLFRLNFTISFTDYLTQFRIEKAKSLLSENSVSEVATLCGFVDQSRFSKVFKESAGISPKEFKRMFLTE